MAERDRQERAHSQRRYRAEPGGRAVSCLSDQTDSTEVTCCARAYLREGAPSVVPALLHVARDVLRVGERRLDAREPGQVGLEASVAPAGSRTTPFATVRLTTPQSKSSSPSQAESGNAAIAVAMTRGVRLARAKGNAGPRNSS